MKSFIFALLMLFAISLFVTINASHTTSHINEMLQLTETLPKTKTDFEELSDQVKASIIKLTELWDQYFPLISFTAGYENTNRCDEAIGALEMHFKNGNGEDFSVSLSEFCDSLARLKILEGFHWQGLL